MSRLSSSPIDSAWALLKQEEPGSLEDLLSPEDKRAAAQFMESLPPHQRHAVEMMSQIFYGMPEEQQDAGTGEIHQMLQQHLHNLPAMFEQAAQLDILPTGGGEPVEKSLALEMAYEGRMVKLIPLIIGVVFAIDAINRSQGAKGSIIGSGLKTAANAALGTQFDEGWGDVTEYHGGEFGAQARWVNPITGTEGELIEDPTWYESLGYGAAASLAAVNPFSAVRAGGIAARGASAAARAKGMRGVGHGLAWTGKGKTARMGKKAGEAAAKESRDAAGLMGLYADDAARTASRGAKSRRTRWGEGLVEANPPPGAQNYLPPQQHTLLSQKLFPGSTAARRFDRFQDVTQGGGFGTQVLGAGARAYHGGKEAFAPAIGALLGGWAARNLHQEPSFGHTGGSASFGGPTQHGGQAGAQGQGYNMGNIATGMSQRSDFAPIWQEARTGSGTWHKGENMRIGDRILKEVEDKMDSENKEGKSKKPSHGLVIVIGGKAGPGPSTEGKRDKLDSEKEE